MTSLDRAKKCMDQFVTDWDKTNLSDMEKWFTGEWLIQGAAHMALYFLDFNDYYKLKQYVYEKYRYDIGGMKGAEEGRFLLS